MSETEITFDVPIATLHEKDGSLEGHDFKTARIAAGARNGIVILHGQDFNNKFRLQLTPQAARHLSDQLRTMANASQTMFDGLYGEGDDTK